MNDVDFLQSVLDLTRGDSKVIPENLYHIARYKVGLSDEPDEECRKILAENFVKLHFNNDYYIEEQEIKGMCEILDIISLEVYKRRLN
jgi:hypothetical protein